MLFAALMTAQPASAGQPDVMALLRFGQPPLPLHKPAFRARPVMPAVVPVAVPAVKPQAPAIVEASVAAPVPPEKPVVAAAKPPRETIIARLARAGRPAVAAPVSAPVVAPPVSAVAVLADDDTTLYREIFALQDDAKWGEADALIKKVADPVLMGHVLFQRYMHPTGYRAGFAELKNWLDRYADQPGADRIYALAAARRPADFKGTLRAPVTAKGGVGGYLKAVTDNGIVYRPQTARTKVQQAATIRFEKEFRAELTRGMVTHALKRLKTNETVGLLDSVEYDRLVSLAAARYMYEGDIAKALEIALPASKRSGSKSPLAGWTAGLALWRQGQYKQAAPLFEQMGVSPYASAWARSAGAYWASRAHMRAGNVRAVSPWLEKAASYPQTFYGLIATRALGRDFDFNWTLPPVDEAALTSFPAGRRALALVAVGRNHMAESELRRVDVRGNTGLRQTVLAYAARAGLPGLALRMGESVAAPDGSLYAAALYPVVPWQPAGGYTVDRALINAIVRQESRFDPQAESNMGARGLMQLMPATASFVSGTRSYRDGHDMYGLKKPETNLAIGQRYVENLLDHDQIGTELFSMVMAYNAGPGNLSKWKRSLAMNDDPLLFIESIPSAETRDFVERVMSNYWIYSLRLNRRVPSLDAVVEGGWARYVALDGVKQASASNLFGLFN